MKILYSEFCSSKSSESLTDEKKLNQVFLALLMTDLQFFRIRSSREAIWSKQYSRPKVDSEFWLGFDFRNSWVQVRADLKISWRRKVKRKGGSRKSSRVENADFMRSL